MRLPISSLWTPVPKFMMPLVIVGIFGYMTAAGFAQELPRSANTAPLPIRWILLAVTLLAAAAFVWQSKRLMKVSFDGRTLFISNYFREIEVPVSWVVAVSQSRWSKSRAVTLVFEPKTEFGHELQFMPQLRVRDFLWRSGHPIVSILRAASKGRSTGSWGSE